MKGSRATAVSGCVAAVLLVLAVGISVCACGGSVSPSSAPSATPTTPTSASPSASRLNLPTDEVMAALEGRIAAWMRGDGQAAADFYAADAVMKEMDVDPDYGSEGRENIRWRLQDLYGGGIRLRPADLPLQYDRYVAEPVTFYSPWDDSTNIGMLVFEMDADNKFANQ